jgi:FMN phosphatase YigB (HAD superfamily)
MSVEAFIFDIGNVLVRFDYARANRAMRSMGAGEPDMAALELLAKNYERGGVTRADFLRQLADIFQHGGTSDELVRAWQDIFEPNLPMWEFVERLHGSYPLYLLSNTNCLQHDFIQAEYRIFEKFSDGVFSYRAGMLKPEPEIFELAIRQFNVRPAATVYIDDLAPNVEAARAAGLRAFLYHPDAHDGFLSGMRAMGVQSV